MLNKSSLETNYTYTEFDMSEGKTKLTDDKRKTITIQLNNKNRQLSDKFDQVVYGKKILLIHGFPLQLKCLKITLNTRILKLSETCKLFVVF